MDDTLIIEIWDTFKDYITEKNRDAVATAFVDFLVAKDVTDTVLESLLGYDPHLDSAIEIVLEEFRDSDFDSDEYDYDEDDGDEDY